MKNIDNLTNNMIDSKSRTREDLFDDVFDLLESEDLPRGPKHAQWSKELDDPNISDSRIAEIINEIKAVQDKRKFPKANIKIYSKNKTEAELAEIEDEINSCREHVHYILILSASDPHEFLGNGSVGEAFRIKGYEGMCIKIIHSDEMYNELDYRGERVQNRIDVEGNYLETLETLEVAGVRVPKPLFYIETHALKGIAMESLRAVNFARVIEGQDEMPKNFDLEEYFSRLSEYMVAMHERGVIHRDIALRNFMIDTVTGYPYLIDFGKSKNRDDFFASDKTFEEAAESEMAALQVAKNDAINKLNNIN